MQIRGGFGLRDNFVDKDSVNRFSDFFAARAGEGDAVDPLCVELRNHAFQRVERGFNRFAFMPDIRLMQNFIIIIDENHVNTN
ncbi:hypothetical protein U14_02312 [Candidatus Moduliflexus flocculans]|uniref:Uncharacterized protein n=1 Tax=Candidatus Moduliflexus flocculans TaxID=1499966 RepID=A0A0S6W0B2_9BACT|nr:hypothetical protein U14_02312 [Candidatus Moduliflexus flocculans]